MAYQYALGATGDGEDAIVGPFVFAAQHLTGARAASSLRTVYVKPGGTAYTTIVIQGLIGADPSDSTNWVAAVGVGFDSDDKTQVAIEVDTSKAGAYALGCEYLGLRVVCTGGNDDDSTIDAGLIG